MKHQIALIAALLLTSCTAPPDGDASDSGAEVTTRDCSEITDSQTCEEAGCDVLEKQLYVYTKAEGCSEGPMANICVDSAFNNDISAFYWQESSDGTFETWSHSHPSGAEPWRDCSIEPVDACACNPTYDREVNDEDNP